MKLDLAITGVGMMTPVGLSAPVCMHSVRSGITRLTTQPYPDRVRKWVVGGCVMERIPYLRDRRLAAWAKSALGEALAQACGKQPASLLGPIGVVVGTAEPIRPGFKFPAPAFDLAKWAGACGVKPIGPCEILEEGNCSVQLALARAAQMLDSGVARACIIGATDSLLQMRVIRWHENHYRLKCTYMSDGLAPGEAACFLVVEKETAARARDAVILARALATASDKESATVLAGGPNTAGGLTRAVRTALADAGVPAVELDAVWCDLNGESYRSREWAFTEVRAGLRNQTELYHPADCHGDLGAASDANLLCLAVLAQATGWANNRPQLVFAGSERGMRAATLIGTAGPMTPLSPVTRMLPCALPVDVRLPPLAPDASNYLESANPPRTYFEWAVRQDHLEELASIYYQRKSLFRAGEVPWTRAREPEQRILNHLDATIAGGAESIWAVASGLKSTEEGTCFAGALLLGLLARHDNLGRIDELLQEPDATNLSGIEAGLRHVPMHPALQKHLDAWLEHPQPKVRALAIGVLSYHRAGDPVKVVQFPQSRDPDIVRASLVACCRYRYLYAIPAVQKVVDAEDIALAGEALLTLLCLGAKSAPDQCRTLCRGQGPRAYRAALLLALKGNQPDLAVILKAGGDGLDHAEKIAAVGVLGNLQGLAFLLEAVKSPRDDVKVAAATALDMITGAGLREEAVVTEITDLGDGDVLEDKREVTRVATSPQAWIDWWQRHRGRFHTRSRWRLGQPFEPLVCLAELDRPDRTYEQRMRAYHELVIQTDGDIPFEADWFVPLQEKALGKWRDWLARRA